jgi:hypothetical protein
MSTINQQSVDHDLREYVKGDTALQTKVNEISLSLTQNAKQTTTKAILLSNESTDNQKPFEIYNKAGQGSANLVSETTHHYSDGTAKVIDNVGTGIVLNLRNSHNPGNRPDKPADFVGSGNYIEADVYDNATGTYKNVMILDKMGHLHKSGYHAGNDSTFMFKQLKQSNGFWGFRFENIYAHTTAFDFRNGGKFISLMAESSNTKAVFFSEATQTAGLEIRTGAGDLLLKATGKVQMFFNGAFYPVQPVITNTQSKRPVNTAVGFNSFDTDLGKPIWCKTVNDGYSTNVLHQSNKAYLAQTLVLKDGIVYEANANGITASTPPTFPTTVGQTVTDGTVVWTCRGVPSVWVDATGATV